MLCVGMAAAHGLLLAAQLPVAQLPHAARGEVLHGPPSAPAHTHTLLLAGALLAGARSLAPPASSTAHVWLTRPLPTLRHFLRHHLAASRGARVGAVWLGPPAHKLPLLRRRLRRHRHSAPRQPALCSRASSTAASQPRPPPRATPRASSRRTPPSPPSRSPAPSPPSSSRAAPRPSIRASASRSKSRGRSAAA